MENVLMACLIAERHNFEFSKLEGDMNSDVDDEDDSDPYADFNGAWIHNAPSDWAHKHPFCELHWALDEASHEAASAIPQDLDFTLIFLRLDNLGMKDSICSLLEDPSTYPYYDHVKAQLSSESVTRDRLKSIKGSLNLVPEG